MTDVVEINSIEGLRPYHLAWNALLADTPRASFFQTLEWLETYWRHFGEGKRLRVLIARAGGKPLGILPLVEQVERTRVGPLRVLTFPLEDWSAWYGPIGPYSTATLSLAMRWIAETPRTWDLFEPRWLAHETVDRGRTQLAMKLSGVPARVATHGSSSLIDCVRLDGWEGYLASLSSKTRHELLRKRRALERRHWVERIRYRPLGARCGDGDPRWELYEGCVDVARRSWQAMAPGGVTLSTPRCRAFLSEAHERAARLGMVEMNLILLDGVAAAFYYGYHCAGFMQGLRMGYDPALTKGAGAALLSYVIEGCFAEGDQLIDLGPGEERYKKRLRTHAERSSRLTHIPAGAWRPRARRAAHWLRDRFVGRAG